MGLQATAISKFNRQYLGVGVGEGQHIALRYGKQRASKQQGVGQSAWRVHWPRPGQVALHRLWHQCAGLDPARLLFTVCAISMGSDDNTHCHTRYPLPIEHENKGCGTAWKMQRRGTLRKEKERSEWTGRKAKAERARQANGDGRCKLQNWERELAVGQSYQDRKLGKRHGASQVHHAVHCTWVEQTSATDGHPYKDRQLQSSRSVHADWPLASLPSQGCNYRLVQWNWFSDVTGCMQLRCI